MSVGGPTALPLCSCLGYLVGRAVLGLSGLGVPSERSELTQRRPRLGQMLSCEGCKASIRADRRHVCARASFLPCSPRRDEMSSGQRSLGTPEDMDITKNCGLRRARHQAWRHSELDLSSDWNGIRKDLRTAARGIRQNQSGSAQVTPGGQASSQAEFTVLWMSPCPTKCKAENLLC